MYHCYKSLLAEIKAVWWIWSLSPAFDPYADSLTCHYAASYRTGQRCIEDVFNLQL